MNKLSELDGDKNFDKLWIIFIEVEKKKLWFSLIFINLNVSLWLFFITSNNALCHYTDQIIHTPSK